MPIIKTLPDEVTVVTPLIPGAIEEPYQSQFVNVIPEAGVTSLLKYVEGYPWSVNFYGQFLSEDHNLNSYDPDVPNLLQPYYKINNLVFKVSTPLDSNYNTETSITTISGAAIVPYSVRPNIGDLFIANTDTGEDAVFSINTVQRKTYRKETLYEITYTLTFYLSTNPTWLSNLESKVQQTFYYNETNDHTGKGNLLTPVVYEAIQRLNSYYSSTIDYYFTTFYQKVKGTILVPGQLEQLYDPLLMKFLMRIVNTDQHINISKIALFSTSGDQYIDQPSIWDAILKRDLNALYLVNKKYRFISTLQLFSLTRLGAMSTAGINGLLYPLDAETNGPVNTVLNAPALTATPGIDISPVYQHGIIEVATDITVLDTSTGLNVNKPLLHSLFVDNYYIVSSNFYDHVAAPTTTTLAALSYIELLIYKFMTNQAIAKEDLVVAIQSYNKWPLLHQFYLLPVMWAIFRSQGV